jgi:hypothetical protein
MFKKNKKSLKDLDKNEIIIRWGDKIIFHANHLGEVRIDSFDPALIPSETSIPNEILDIREEIIARLDDKKENLDIRTNELISYLQGVKNHLLSHKYIQDPKANESFWRLNDTGESMKEFGGHKKYKAFKKREFDAIRSDQNSKIYWWWRDWHKAIVGIIVGGIAGLFAEHQLDIINTIKKILSPAILSILQ